MRRMPGLGCAVLLWALPPSSDLGEAYRLATSTDAVRIPSAMEARRWSRDRWAPGRELVMHVANDPDWAVRFDSPEQALEYVTGRPGVWSAAPGDILDAFVAGLPAQDGG